ncbi:MAG: hypothetical protein NZ529_00055 [Cytophagaceae bacterium]|nr:hypothetical protein [Cytophagaceae bacterium]MDW8455158.1 hypothetical protein [Cytophagaceae bacterium]
MADDFYKYFVIIVSSMFKFVLGPILGNEMNVPVWLTAILTATGMMLSVTIFTTVLGNIFHQWVKKTFFKNKKLFTKSNRKKVLIWKKYGMAGVAFLTPLIFTPIGGTLIANSFGENKLRIVTYMLVSATIWAVVLSLLISLFPSLSSYLQLKIQ